MSSTFMRGLAMLETIDLHGPITVTELARRTGVDTSIVSRTLTACERDGWIERRGGRVTLGPRAALLAHVSPTAALIRESEPLVDAISGVTGCLAQACAIAGETALIIAAAGPSSLAPGAGLGAEFPLYATAAGQVIAAQLDPSQLDRLLPPDPFPDPMEALLRKPVFASLASMLADGSAHAIPPTDLIARTRRELDERLERVRADGACLDRGEIHPALSCLAMPWPHAPSPAALVCMTSPADLAAHEDTIWAVLTAAVAPGATRTDIAAAAAKAAHPSAGQRSVEQLQVHV